MSLPEPMLISSIKRNKYFSANNTKIQTHTTGWKVIYNQIQGITISTNNEFVKVFLNGYTATVESGGGINISTSIADKYKPDGNVYSFYHSSSDNKVFMRPDGVIESTSKTSSTAIFRCVLTYPMKN